MELSIKEICGALEVLVGSSQNGDVQHFSNIDSALQERIKSLVSLMQSNEVLHDHVLSLYSRIVEDKYDDTRWRFVECCITLALLLKDAMINALKDAPDEVSAKEHHQPLPSDAPSLTRDSLSVQQQKTVSSALQFIVALGMWPSLLPGIQNIVKSRSKFSSLLLVEGRQMNPWKAHRRLITCVISMLAIFKHSTLGALGLSQHLGDLLASLCQICYAPIKQKPYDQCPQSSKDTAQQTLLSTSGICKESRTEFSLDCFADISKCLHNCYASEGSDSDLIDEMWKDRLMLSKEMCHLLTRVFQPMIIKELLILQGAPISRVKQSIAGTSSQLPASPSWLRKVCAQLLSEQLIQPQGVWALIQSVLEFCPDLSSELHGKSVRNTDWMKCEAVAKLVVLAAPSVNMAEYYQQVGTQVISLLQGDRDSGHLIQFRIASAIIFYMAETQPQLACQFIMNPLLKHLLNCLITGKDNVDLMDEQQLSQCIENLHKILTCASVPTSKFLEHMQPVLHPLFILGSACEDKITYLREFVEDILAVILKHTGTDTATNALHFLLFGSPGTGKLQKTSENVTFLLGESGGMKAVMQAKDRSPEVWLQENELQIKFLMQILEKMNDKKFAGTFFVSLLQRLTNVLIVKDDQQPTTSSSSSFAPLLGTELQQQVQEEALRKNLLLLGLLQKLAEVYDECLLDDQPQAVQFIKVTLERGAQLCHSRSVDEEKELEVETLMMAMGALVMMLEKKDKFQASDWTMLKTCLASLDALTSNHPNMWVKSMAKELTITIRTHGVAGDYKQNVSGPEMRNVETPTTRSDGERQMTEKRTLVERPQARVMEENGETIQSPRSAKSIMKNEQEQKSPQELSPYQRAFQELHHPLLPVRGHALIVLKSLVVTRDAETLQNKDKLLQVFREHLADSDSYIYLPSIQGLSTLADLYSDEVLPVITAEFAKIGELKASYPVEVRLKLGEAIIKCVQNLGDIAQKYRDLLLNTFLSGTKDSDPLVRSSSLSNLGEVCKHLRFSLGLFIQEILCCLQSFIKTDPSVEVRRAALMVLTNIFQGCGKDTLKVLEAEMLDIYRMLKHIYQNDRDDVMKLHAQLALDEIREIITQVLQSKPSLVKEIRILDPF